MKPSNSALLGLGILTLTLAGAAEGKPKPAKASPAVTQAANAALMAAFDATQAQSTINSEEFKRAERANDIDAMRKMLVGTNIVVLEPNPLFSPLCIPPYGTLYWGYAPVYGPNPPPSGPVMWYMAYGQWCNRSGGNAVPLDVLPSPSD